MNNLSTTKPNKFKRFIIIIIIITIIFFILFYLFIFCIFFFFCKCLDININHVKMVDLMFTLNEIFKNSVFFLHRARNSPMKALLISVVLIADPNQVSILIILHNRKIQWNQIGGQTLWVAIFVAIFLYFCELTFLSVKWNGKISLKTYYAWVRGTNEVHVELRHQ